MNIEYVYTDSGHPYAFPESSVLAPDAIPILRQPIMGEDGFLVSERPKVANVPDEFDVTFELDLVEPSGVNHVIDHVIIGILGATNGSSPDDFITVTQTSNNNESNLSWYSYPVEVQDRRRRKIMTAAIDAVFPFDALGTRKVDIQRVSGVQFVYARATYRSV